MTKYREILRLSSLGLSQQNIADSCNVSKKTVNRVLRRAKELDISWPLDESDTDAVLAEKFFPSANQVTSNKRMPDYAYIRKELLRNGVSKNFFGRNTWRSVEPMAMNHSCIHNSATTSNRMSRNIVLPCISTINPVNRLKLIGQVILQQSLIRIPVKSSKPTYLSV